MSTAMLGTSKTETASRSRRAAVRRSRRRTLVIAAGVTCLVATSLVAWARPGPAETHDLDSTMTISAGSCLDGARLKQWTAHWLRRDRVDRRITIEVVEEPTGEVVFTVLRQGVRVAERRFERVACHDMHVVVSLAIASAIDATPLVDPAPAKPSASASTSAPALASAPAPASTPSEPASGRSVRSLPSKRAPKGDGAFATASSEPRWRVRAGAHGTFGVLPDLAVGALGAAALRLGRRAEVDVELAVTFPRTLAVGSGHVELMGGWTTAAACWMFAPGIATSGCLGVRVGVTQGRGRDFESSYERKLPWFGTVLRVTKLIPLSERVAIFVSAEGQLAVQRARFSVLRPNGSASDSVSASALSAGLSVGPSLQFQ